MKYDRHERPADNFVRKYNAKIEESHYRYRYPVTSQPFHKQFNDEYFTDMRYAEEVYVAIHIPKDNFERLVNMESRLEMLEQEQLYSNRLVRSHEADARVRHDNPSVQLAYEKYLTLLELARQ